MVIPFRLIIIAIISLSILAAGTTAGYRFGIYKYDRLVIQHEKEKAAAIAEEISKAKRDKEFQEKVIEELRIQNELLDLEIIRLEIEAGKSPTANNVCLPSDSVRRINKIR